MKEFHVVMTGGIQAPVQADGIKIEDGCLLFWRYDEASGDKEVFYAVAKGAWIVAAPPDPEEPSTEEAGGD